MGPDRSTSGTPPTRFRVADGIGAPPPGAVAGPRWGCITILVLLIALGLCCGGWGVRERWFVVPVEVDDVEPVPPLAPPPP